MFTVKSVIPGYDGQLCQNNCLLSFMQRVLPPHFPPVEWNLCVIATGMRVWSAGIFFCTETGRIQSLKSYRHH